MPWALIVLVVASSCSDGRPTVAEWQPMWDDLVQSLPERSAIGADPDQERCNEVLVAIRTREADILPTPDPALDDTARDWLAVARDAFFECPPATNLQGFEGAYDELDVLRAEMEAGLAALDR